MATWNPPDWEGVVTWWDQFVEEVRAIRLARVTGEVQMIGKELAKAKIKKLRKMTTAAGCTREEAASAEAKIAEIMTKYGMMNEGDLSLLYRSRQRRFTTDRLHH